LGKNRVSKMLTTWSLRYSMIFVNTY